MVLQNKSETMVLYDNVLFSNSKIEQIVESNLEICKDETHPLVTNYKQKLSNGKQLRIKLDKVLEDNIFPVEITL